MEKISEGTIIETEKGEILKVIKKNNELLLEKKRGKSVSLFSRLSTPYKIVGEEKWKK